MATNTQTGGMETELVERFDEFLHRYCSEAVGELAQHYPREQQSIEVDWMDLFKFDADLAEDFMDDPAAVREYFEAALERYDLPHDVDLSGAHVRVTGLPVDERHSVGGSRANDIGTFAGIDGQVAKVSGVNPVPEDVAFECQRCGHLTRVPQHDAGIQEPHECESCDRNGPFRIDEDATEFRNHQLVRLQQPPEETKGGSGDSIDVHLEEDLVEAVDPGDRATIMGDLDVEEPGDGQQTFSMYMQGRSVDIQETDFEEVELTEEDRDTVREIASGERGDPFELLRQSIAPKHRGDPEIKLALGLQLFGGTHVEYPDGNADRGDLHILLLGEPGTGKSTLLRAVEQAAPRSIYTSGKGASAAGMTAAAVPDDFGETKWSLEAGALVMAHKGVACVDEIDKVQEDARDSMHEALASQTVSINKAGINAQLPAQTALLAAGNPKYGRFNPNEPYADQIDLGPTLLSRFDLWFMVSDRPNEEDDRDIAGHMLDARREAIAQSENQSTDADVEIAPAINEELLRKYVAYARKAVTPRIEDDAVAQKLEDWYANLRSANGTGEQAPVPVTARKLEAVQRLAEASARVRLSNTVDEEDARRACQLVGQSMRDVGVDPESGDLDVDVIETGTSSSQRARRETVEAVVQDVCDDGPALLEDVIDELEREGVNRDRAEHAIEDLFDRGVAYQPGERQIHWIG